MTLEQLLGASAEELEGWSHEERVKFFEPYLKITRPEFGRIPKKIENRKPTTDPDLERKKAALKQFYKQYYNEDIKI